jgi:hypothetical protein
VYKLTLPSMKATSRGGNAQMTWPYLAKYHITGGCYRSQPVSNHHEKRNGSLPTPATRSATGGSTLHATASMFTR